MYGVPGTLNRLYVFAFPSAFVFSNSIAGAADWSDRTFHPESSIVSSSGPAVAQELSTNRTRFAPARPRELSTTPPPPPPRRPNRVPRRPQHFRVRVVRDRRRAALHPLS